MPRGLGLAHAGLEARAPVHRAAARRAGLCAASRGDEYEDSPHRGRSALGSAAEARPPDSRNRE